MSKTYELIGKFQSSFRDYLASKIDVKTLNDELDRSRDFANRKQLELASFKHIVLSNKSVFLPDFGKKAHNLPTWLDDLLEIRNKVAHYEEISEEDINEAVWLIRRISELAGLSTIYLDSKTARPAEPIRKEDRSQRVADTVSYSELDRVLDERPVLSLKRTKGEYRIFRNGIGRGSLWIAKQSDGYRLVTTGVTNSLKSDIERLTGLNAFTMQDRDHLWWKGLSINTLESILIALEKL